MLAPAPKSPTDPHQQKIIVVYAIFGLSLICSLAPFMIAAAVSILLLLGVLIAAYGMRAGADQDSLTHNHMTFIIRTIWIGGFIGSITMAVAGIYLFYMIDNTPLDACIQNMQGGISPEQLSQPESMMGMFEGCISEYWRVNLTTFIIAAAVGILPVLLYFLVRYARGFSRAIGGYRIAHPLNWF